MKIKRPTMNDVARLAGVSQPTVSRVLNEDSTTVQISDDTKHRVMKAVEELGYRPNAVARSLRTQRTQTIALMIADISNGFYHVIARAVQDVARKHRYEVLISNSDHTYENEKHFCDIVLARGIDGAIVVPIHLTTEDLNPFVSRSHVPIVALGEQINHPYIDVAYADDERATYEATKWLICECGYKKIGYIGVPDFHPPGPRRLHGFTRAMEEAGLPIDPRWMKKGDFSRESGGRVAEDYLKLDERPSAVVVINDLMAIGAILAFQDAGCAVPDDIAVLGFDDIPEATIVRPTLTTIAQDPYDIGYKLATALFERIENPNFIARRVYECTLNLVERQSTRRLNA